MADTTMFELVSPERLLMSKEVSMVVVPGADGFFGVLPRHSPLLSTLLPGVIDVYEDGSVTDRIFVAGGFAEVTEDRCTVLAEEATQVAELDIEAAEGRLSDLRDELKDATGSEADRLTRRIAESETVLVAMRAAKNG
ncbi:MAG: ATP synthase F1 subunit epsilon [Alphaproteobacteria bacterium]|jgi:F-type H+-transporting ATPase subunit epsilon|nr:ATP synthase F1 subunit epsilon [Alphaproteobacteria bacterium]